MRDPRDELDALDSRHLLRRLRTIAPSSEEQNPSGVLVELDGRQLINFSSNDYLGLAHGGHSQSGKSSPAGSGASRLVCGTHPAHIELEQTLADFKQTEAALTFSTGYACAVGTLQALLQKNDIVILDKLSHASLIDGARLSGATIRVFPHNDMAKLDHHLAWAKNKVADHKDDARILIVTESIFSMDGDRAPLREIVELKEQHDALLLVDEAHAFGIVGPQGRGLAAELGIADRIDLNIGTLSKAAGLSGGFLAGRRDYIDLCIQRARSFIYSTAPPPALADAARRSIDLIAGKAGDRLRDQLWKNIRLLTAELDLHEPSSAIVPIILGSNERALAAAEQLLESGFLIPAIRYPTVPRDQARLRLTVSSAHSEEQIQSIAAAIRKLL
jgi:8-amino-7-oxononanoate synthase